MSRLLLSVLSALILITALIGSGGTAADRGDDTPQPARGDVTTARLESAATAIPSAQHPSADDEITDVLRAHAPGVHAVASATSTSDCDACRGTSSVLQIVLLGGPGARADNTAVAWSSCTGCQSTAVAVQVVMGRRAGDLSVNNRSLALNAACTGCTTTAVAIQFVVVGRVRDLSADARRMIAELEAQLAAVLQSPAPSARARSQGQGPDSRGAADDAAQRMDRIIADDVGGANVTQDVHVSTGSSVG